MLKVIRDSKNPAADIAAGCGVAFYEADYPTANKRYAEQYPEADNWYTERNGDPITLLVPKGTPPEELPPMAMDYFVMVWIDPDYDFGTGVRPRQG